MISYFICESKFLLFCLMFIKCWQHSIGFIRRKSPVVIWSSKLDFTWPGDQGRRFIHCCSPQRGIQMFCGHLFDVPRGSPTVSNEQSHNADLQKLSSCQTILQLNSRNNDGKHSVILKQRGFNISWNKPSFMDTIWAGKFTWHKQHRAFDLGPTPYAPHLTHFTLCPLPYTLRIMPFTSWPFTLRLSPNDPSLYVLQLGYFALCS